MAKKTHKLESSREDKLMVLMEHMQDDIKAIAEGHSGLQRGIDNLNEGQLRLEKRMDSLESRFDRFELETKNNFQVVFEYLSRIDDQLADIKKDLETNYEKKGWDAKWRKSIEDRIEKVEKLLKNKDLSASILRDKDKHSYVGTKNRKH